MDANVAVFLIFLVFVLLIFFVGSLYLYFDNHPRSQNLNVCNGVMGKLFGHKFVTMDLSFRQKYCLRCGAPFAGGRRK